MYSYSSYLGENAIVSQFDPCEERIFGHYASIVVRSYTTFNTLQHIRANRWIVNVAANMAVAQVLEDW